MNLFVRRSFEVGCPTILFCWLGSEAGESFDTACQEKALNCTQAASDFVGEKIGTFAGGYIGLVFGIGCMMVDAYINSRNV